MTTYIAYAHIYTDPNSETPFGDLSPGLEVSCTYACFGSDGSTVVISPVVATVSWGDSADDIRTSLVSAIQADVFGGFSVTLLAQDVIWI